MFAIDHDAQVTELTIEQSRPKPYIIDVFDIPALDALLLDTNNGSILLRKDDGETIVVGPRPKWDTIVAVEVQIDQSSLVVKTSQGQSRFALPKKTWSGIVRNSAAMGEDESYSMGPGHPRPIGYFKQGRRWSAGLDSYIESDFHNL